MRWFLLAFLLLGCVKVETMAWPVQCGQTRLLDLDRRYADEVYDIAMTGACDQYASGLQGPEDAIYLSECPAYHSVWRRYWSAKRSLDKCETEPVNQDWVKL